MEFLNPSKKVEENFGLRPGMKAVDFGCGAGHFTVAMAKQVGNDGTVYAFDIQPEVLSSLKSSAAAAGVFNIECGRVDLENDKATGLADQLVDFALISNVLFQVGDKEAVAREAFRILKSGGRLAVIDWNEASILGPAKESRMKRLEAEKIFGDTGFRPAGEFNAGPSHYGLMFIKNV